MGTNKFGIDPAKLSHYAHEIQNAASMGTQISIVIGGGNIFRGLQAEATGIEKVTGDYMGMIATLINGMALQSALEQIGVETRLLSAIEIREVAEPYIRRRAIRHLERGRVVIFGAGTGSPYFTTDSAAALRASEIDADVILKGTRVNGVFSADPEQHPDAEHISEISFRDVIKLGLRVMDMTAFTLCEENNLPIIIFDINTPGNLKRIIDGEHVGSRSGSNVRE
jgi:uridylate kinase